MADLPFVIKICGITNEEDAQEAVDGGANALGFNFYRNSPRYITPARAQQIIAKVSGHYLRVGVFVNPPEDELAEIAQTVDLDIVQLHGDHCPTSFSRPFRVWRSIAPSAAANDQNVEAYLLDTPSAGFGGSGETFDWRWAKVHTSRIILAGGLDSSNVAEAIRIANPWGVDACSRLESSPGKKSAQKVREFVRAAQLAVEQDSYTRVNL
jgi:phosphoribosylanthranilate isomerase